MYASSSVEKETFHFEARGAPRLDRSGKRELRLNKKARRSRGARYQLIVLLRRVSARFLLAPWGSEGSEVAGMVQLMRQRAVPLAVQASQHLGARNYVGGSVAPALHVRKFYNNP